MTKSTKPVACNCWICQPHLKNVLKKLRGKERKWLQDLINDAIHWQDAIDYCNSNHKRK